MYIRLLLEYPLEKKVGEEVYKYIKNWFDFQLENILSVEFPPNLYFKTGELDSNSLLNFINGYQLSSSLIITITKGVLRDGLNVIYGKNRCNKIIVSKSMVEKPERVAKIVLHEIGHFYGLRDSNNRHCFMGICGLPKQEFIQVLDSVSDFCDVCKKRLRKVKEFVG